VYFLWTTEKVSFKRFGGRCVVIKKSIQKVVNVYSDDDFAKNNRYKRNKSVPPSHRHDLSQTFAGTDRRNFLRCDFFRERGGLVNSQFRGAETFPSRSGPISRRCSDEIIAIFKRDVSFARAAVKTAKSFCENGRRAGSRKRIRRWKTGPGCF